MTEYLMNHIQMFSATVGITRIWYITVACSCTAITFYKYLTRMYKQFWQNDWIAVNINATDWWFQLFGNTWEYVSSYCLFFNFIDAAWLCEDVSAAFYSLHKTPLCFEEFCPHYWNIFYQTRLLVLLFRYTKL